MFIYRFFLPDGDGDAGGNMGGEAAPPVNPEVDASDEEEETGGVTPEDVMKTMGLPAPTAKEDDDNGDTASDTEEDDADLAGTGSEDDEPAAAPADEPEGKPATDKSPEGDTPADADTPDFTVTVEDIDGVSYKIESLADLPEDFKAQSDRQALEILDQLRDARDRRNSYEAEQAANAERAERDARIAEITQTWDAEFEDLAGQKLVQSGDTERKQQILGYLAEENAKREQNGRPLIASLTDAYYGLQAQESRENAARAAKEAKETARRNGGLVGGSSAPATGNGPVYRAGSARNMNEAIRRAGLL